MNKVKKRIFSILKTAETQLGMQIINKKQILTKSEQVNKIDEMLDITAKIICGNCGYCYLATLHSINSKISVNSKRCEQCIERERYTRRLSPRSTFTHKEYLEYLIIRARKELKFEFDDKQGYRIVLPALSKEGRNC